MPIFLYVQLVPAVSFGDRVAGDVVFLSLYDSIGRERGYSKRHDTRTRIPNAHFAPLPDAGVKEFEIFNHFCVFLSEHSKSAGCSDLAALHVQGILGTGLFPFLCARLGRRQGRGYTGKEHTVYRSYLWALSLLWSLCVLFPFFCVLLRMVASATATTNLFFLSQKRAAQIIGGQKRGAMGRRADGCMSFFVC